MEIKNQSPVNKIETKPTLSKKSKEEVIVTPEVVKLTANDNLAIKSNTENKASVINFIDEDFEALKNFSTPVNYNIDLSIDKNYFLNDKNIFESKSYFKSEDFDYLDKKQEPKTQTQPITSYDKKGSISTTEIKQQNSITKTIYDDKNKQLSAEISSGNSKSNIKFNGGFDGQSQEFKTFGFESNQDSTNIKANYDPKAEGFSAELKTGDGSNSFKVKSEYDGKTSKFKSVTIENTIAKDTGLKASYNPESFGAEVSQKISGADVKVNTDYDLKSSNVKQVVLETSAGSTHMKTAYVTSGNSLNTELGIGDTNKVKFTGDYSIQSSRINRAGIEYGFKDFNISTAYVTTPEIESKTGALRRGLEMKVKNNFGEVTTGFAMRNNGVEFNKVQVAKPVSFGQNMPDMKLNFEYTNDQLVGDTQATKRVGVGIEAKLVDKASLTYSAKIGDKSNIHSLGIKYNFSENTDFSLDANVNDTTKTNPGFRAMFNTSFKF